MQERLNHFSEEKSHLKQVSSFEIVSKLLVLKSIDIVSLLPRCIWDSKGPLRIVSVELPPQPVNINFRTKFFDGIENNSCFWNKKAPLAKGFFFS